MRRVLKGEWLWPWVFVLLACVYIVAGRSTAQSLLKDSDTAFLLDQLKLHPEPFRWFMGDWPLQNHFYRPVSTAFFQFDLAIYGRHAAGFGLTNALLSAGCVAFLFWFLREFTNNRLLATCSTLLFAYWLEGGYLFFLSNIWIISTLCFVGCIWRHGLSFKRTFIPPLAVHFLLTHLFPIWGIQTGITDWLPGRTASSMTLFVLVSLALYARAIRTGTERTKPEPTPLDPPATKSSGGTEELASRSRVIFLLALSFVAAALALGCYEQAVTVPLLALTVLLVFRFRGYRSGFWPIAGFFALLGGYIGLRLMIVPPSASGYQLQQFRHGPAVFLSFLDFLMPTASQVPSFLNLLSSGPFVLVLLDPWRTMFGFAANVAGYSKVIKQGALALGAYMLSVVAFGPMAWLKIFPHYYFMPLAFRALFSVLCVYAAVQTFITGWSPQTVQAPKRLHPAPGSLPRR